MSKQGESCKRAGSAAVILAAVALAVGAGAGCGDLSGNPIDVLGVRYAPDGRLVLFTSTGIRIYDGRLNSEQRFIEFHPEAWTGSISALSGDGSLAAMSTQEHRDRAVLFDLSTGRQVGSFLSPEVAPGPEYVTHIREIALSSDGQLIHLLGSNVFDGDQSWMIDRSSGAVLWRGPWRPMAAFSPDDDTLYAVETARGAVLAIDSRTGETKFEKSTGAPDFWLLASSLAQNGQALVTALAKNDGCSHLGDCPDDYVVWSASDGARVHDLPELFPLTSSYGSDPNGFAALTCAASAGLCASGVVEYSSLEEPRATKAVIKVWNLADGSVVRTIQPPDGGPHGIALSADGSLLAVAAWGGENGALVYRVSDGALLGQKKFHTGVF